MIIDSETATSRRSLLKKRDGYCANDATALRASASAQVPRVPYGIFIAFTAIATLLFSTSGAVATDDPKRGKDAFSACIACHSIEPNVNKTGPSLANIWGKKAGAVESFDRYSDAIKNSPIIWNYKTLDAWLRDPRALIPGTLMKFRGLDNAAERQGIVAYLKILASGGGQASAGANSMADPIDLSNPPPSNQVTALSLCRDTYHLTTAASETFQYWEFNLRFKTDSSAKGPPKRRPVLLGSGMRGDRAFVVFSSPTEIGAFIEVKC